MILSLIDAKTPWEEVKDAIGRAQETLQMLKEIAHDNAIQERLRATAILETAKIEAVALKETAKLEAVALKEAAKLEDRK